MDCNEVFDKILMVLVLIFIMMAIGVVGVVGYFMIKILGTFTWS